MNIHSDQYIEKVIEDNDLAQLTILIENNAPVLEEALNGWHDNVDTIKHILTQTRLVKSYSDSEIMSMVGWDVEPYILDMLKAEGIDINATFLDSHNNITNFFTELCTIELGVNRSSFIIMETRYHLLLRLGSSYISNPTRDERVRQVMKDKEFMTKILPQ